MEKEIKEPIEIDFSLIPDHMKEGVIRYLEEKKEPGRFLKNVLENNLVESFGFADEINMHNMKQWATFLHNELPASVWGSKKMVKGFLNGEEGFNFSFKVFEK